MKMREERLQVMLSPEELELVDNFRFVHRMPSRAAAVRELLQRGLASAGTVVDPVRTKSANIGVFGRGENSHDGKED
jgi:hypothetical protein